MKQDLRPARSRPWWAPAGSASAAAHCQCKAQAGAEEQHRGRLRHVRDRAIDGVVDDLVRPGSVQGERVRRDQVHVEADRHAFAIRLVAEQGGAVVPGQHLLRAVQEGIADFVTQGVRAGLGQGHALEQPAGGIVRLDGRRCTGADARAAAEQAGSFREAVMSKAPWQLDQGPAIEDETVQRIRVEMRVAFLDVDVELVERGGVVLVDDLYGMALCREIIGKGRGIPTVVAEANHGGVNVACQGQQEAGSQFDEEFGHGFLLDNYYVQREKHVSCLKIFLSKYNEIAEAPLLAKPPL